LFKIQLAASLKLAASFAQKRAKDVFLSLFFSIFGKNIEKWLKNRMEIRMLLAKAGKKGI
jgi:hypothetical protein